jgi:hypothetical protein
MGCLRGFSRSSSTRCSCDPREEPVICSHELCQIRVCWWNAMVDYIHVLLISFVDGIHGWDSHPTFLCDHLLGPPCNIQRKISQCIHPRYSSRPSKAGLTFCTLKEPWFCATMEWRKQLRHSFLPPLTLSSWYCQTGRSLKTENHATMTHLLSRATAGSR